MAQEKDVIEMLGQEIEDRVARQVREAVATERERCAKVAKTYPSRMVDGCWDTATQIADAIRSGDPA